MTHSWHASPRVLRDYAAGSLGDAAAWSVETHVPVCGDCRTRLNDVLPEADGDELAQLRDRLRSLPRPARTPTAWAAARRGVLGPWWAWAGLVASAFTAMTVLGTSPVPASGALSNWAAALAPLVPLAMVATVYALTDRDPAVGASPRGGLELALIRTSVVLVVAIPTVTAGMVIAGAGTAAWLLPGLALCAGALALGPAVGVEPACAGLAGVWAAVVVAAAPPSGLAAAATLVQPSGPVHALWATALLVGAGVVVARRDRFDVPGSPS